QVHGRHALGGQLPCELLRLVFGAGEQQAASLPCCQTAHQFLFGRDVRQVEDVVGHGRDRRLGGVHRVLQGLVQVTLDQDVHAAVQGGREQHPLPGSRGLVQDAADRRQEPEVGHVVGFVED